MPLHPVYRAIDQRCHLNPVSSVLLYGDHRKGWRPVPDEGRVRDSSNRSNELNLAPETPIDEWVSRYGAPLYHFACGMTHDRFVAEDIVQEVFIRAWQTHQRRPQNPLSAAWFYHVTRNLCTDHFRRSRNTTPLDDASFAVDGVGHDAHVTGLGVRQVIRQLGRADQVCLWLFYYGDWPLQDIAAELGITVDAVKTRLTRARRRFGQRWKEQDA